jgi:magnesium-transporting ATPase (P-type)
VSLGIENVVLRGCSLRNTEYVYGLTVFTGHDTKIMQNSSKSKYKLSALEVLTNKSILLILVFQAVCALIGSGIGSYYSTKFADDHTGDAAC